LIRTLLRTVVAPVEEARRRWHLPEAAKLEARRDKRGLPSSDPGITAAVSEAIAWLCRAQDHSATKDGGVARHFSLVNGWGPSYPETTGYIVPSILDFAHRTGDADLTERGKRMLDWLLAIQFPNGAFQGGIIGAQPLVPVTFNTGQILLGLSAGAREFGEPYRSSMIRAADWLVATQDPDGCWRKDPSPFAAAGEKTYDTHVAWGLLEAARLAPDRSYEKAALANVDWALKQQRPNGWFANCCLTDSTKPLTHTLGYALRGIVEAFRFTQDERFLLAAMRTADGLLTAIGTDGFLPGQLSSDWKAAAPWVCLTGTVQIASCWLLLFQATGETRYKKAGQSANRYVRRTQDLHGRPEVRGAIKGSFPVSGEYGENQYLNWAAKFFIDSNLLEQELCTKGS
jgi:Squalene-hopene cyclase C-terminal domain